MTTASTTKPRQTKTPAQRAQEALDVARRHAAKTRAKVTALRNDLKTAEKDDEAAQRRLTYLAENPDLPTTPGAAT